MVFLRGQQSTVSPRETIKGATPRYSGVIESIFRHRLSRPLAAQVASASLLAAEPGRVPAIQSRSESGQRERERERRLARDDLIQATGSVEKILGGGRYQITLESGQTVTAQLSGRMRRFRIRVIPGDRVTVGLSPYDPTHGFITFRLREGQNAP